MNASNKKKRTFEIEKRKHIRNKTEPNDTKKNSNENHQKSSFSECTVHVFRETINLGDFRPIELKIRTDSIIEYSAMTLLLTI